MGNYIFFTLRDFKKTGGGSIRIYSLVNALANKGENVTLISCTKDYTKFHPSIRHVHIDCHFHQKSILQGLIAILPARLIYILFFKLFSVLKLHFASLKLEDSKLIFCEYLDNSIGYILKKNSIISSYINDIHGISTIEFDYQRKNSKSKIRKIIGELKYHLAKRHDKKVFETADGLIYSSKAMKTYLSNFYNLDKVTAYIVPNSISDETKDFIVNEKIRDQLVTKFNLNNNSFVFLFIGGLKLTSGVQDLIQAFEKIQKTYPNTKLLIIGNGPLLPELKKIITFIDLKENIILSTESISYELLKTYQSIANVIVCPDRYNDFSNLILHLKYLDALTSGKIVINGSFDSVLEVNRNENLSINFKPSDIDDLYRSMNYTIQNYEELKNKYKDVHRKVYRFLSYSNVIDVLK